jgi:hypothetical protein
LFEYAAEEVAQFNFELHVSPMQVKPGAHYEVKLQVNPSHPLGRVLELQDYFSEQAPLKQIFESQSEFTLHA